MAIGYHYKTIEEPKYISGKQMEYLDTNYKNMKDSFDLTEMATCGK